MTIQSIELWHKRARPEPTQQNLSVQYGCHLEEVVEQLETISFIGSEGVARRAIDALTSLANDLKSGLCEASIHDRKEFADAFADQIVTGIGVAHCAHIDGQLAVKRVDASNWSKFDDDGQPIFNENGKIMKGPKYAPPNLEGCY